MPDRRFFEDLGPASLGELAELTGAQLADPATANISIQTVAPLDRAGPGEITYFADRRYGAELSTTTAAACFIPKAHAGRAPVGVALLVTAEPLVAYATTAGHLHQPKYVPGGPPIHPTARLEEDVIVGAGAVIGPGATIGRGTRVGAGAVIGVGVQIGRDCDIGANAVIGFALVGDRAHILAGAVIGETGFGVAGGHAGAVDIPQLGRVILQDGVTIGANSCVDRGGWDDTVIGEDTKIDNLVQIGHNVRIGRRCVLAAHTGISGSTTMGDNVRCGGRVGVSDHINIGDGAQLMAAAGLMRDMPSGETWGGFPAGPSRQWMRQVLWLQKIGQGRGQGGGQ
jgi:UDP-3-O-[3-hydroxymyristoyl] glucosamine N-acyltransferase